MGFRPTTLLAAAAGVIAVAALVWPSKSPGDSRGSAEAPRATATASPPALSVALPAMSPEEIEQRRREVEALVAEKNAAVAQQRKAFEDDGWTFVDAAAPDMALAAASPDLLATREPELRAQLASAPPGKEHLGNVVAVATRAREPSTRIAAVEAIGRMGAGDPQRALVDIMKKLAHDDPARQALVPLLRPVSTADPFAREMASLLDASHVRPPEREQMAMTLAVVGLREGGGLPPDVVASMSAESRALVERMTQLALRSAPSRENRP